ncbi:hypothetical protein GGX14DRAFT_406554 [Mycena pura]|uniref:Uncharacterized protein n=1 Tax=Mycena pura TaxID=153505 RepID=A0AAD6UQ32_9AGAR|nr:hypothetical protein GGX14DRAFT_406554 [Mycena pura]
MSAGETGNTADPGYCLQVFGMITVGLLLWNLKLEVYFTIVPVHYENACPKKEISVMQHVFHSRTMATQNNLNEKQLASAARKFPWEKEKFQAPPYFTLSRTKIRRFDLILLYIPERKNQIFAPYFTLFRTEFIGSDRGPATYFEELNTLERYVKTLRKSDAERNVAELEPTADELDIDLLSDKPLMVTPLTEISGAGGSNAGQKRKAIKILEELEDIIF